MTNPTATTEGERLLELFAKAKSIVAAMTPAEYREMIDRQRESWVRAFSTPCEHGELDFEQCGECRGAAAPGTSGSVG